MPDISISRNTNVQRGESADTLSARLPSVEQSAATASGATRDLVSEIAWRLPGCSDLEMRRALIQSARLFCERGNAWTENLPLALSPYGVIPVTPPAGTVVVGVLRIMPQPWGAGLTAFGLGTDEVFLGWGGAPSPEMEPRAIPACLPGAVPHGAFAVVALAPAPGFDSLPPSLAARWGSAICSGAVATLCAMPGKPWSDPVSAAQEGQRFNASVSSARFQFETGGGAIPPYLVTRSKVPFLI